MLTKEMVLQIVREQLFYHTKDRLAAMLVDDLTPVIKHQYQKKGVKQKHTKAVEQAQTTIDESFIFLMRALENEINKTERL